MTALGSKAPHTPAGECGTWNGETVCRRPAGHERDMSLPEEERWHRLGSPYDGRWIDYDDEGREMARGGGIWRYVHGMVHVGGVSALACGDERADLRYWQVPARALQTDRKDLELLEALKLVAANVTCPDCRRELNVQTCTCRSRVDGIDHQDDCRVLERRLDGGPKKRAVILAEAGRAPADADPLGERVDTHAMFQGWGGHADGRHCEHHSRLQAWCFLEDGEWWRCLRDDHPDLSTWRYGRPRLTHLEELPKGALIRDHTSELCLFLNADHRSACRLPEPGEQRLFVPVVEPQCRCHPVGSQASMTLGGDHEDGCPLKITRTAAPIDLLGLGVQLEAVTERLSADLQDAGLVWCGNTDPHVAHEGCDGWRAEAALEESPAYARKEVSWSSASASSDTTILGVEVFDAAEPLVGTDPVPIDPETEQPYTLEVLDAYHARVGLGHEWLTSDRRRELWAAAKLHDLATFLPRRPLFRMSEHVKVTRADGSEGVSGAERTAEKDALAGVTESDRRDVSAWLIREADHRVKFFPQRRDGIDTLMRHLAASVIGVAQGTTPVAPRLPAGRRERLGLEEPQPGVFADRCRCGHNVEDHWALGPCKAYANSPAEDCRCLSYERVAEVVESEHADAVLGRLNAGDEEEPEWGSCRLTGHPCTVRAHWRTPAELDEMPTAAARCRGCGSTVVIHLEPGLRRCGAVLDPPGPAERTRYGELGPCILEPHGDVDVEGWLSAPWHRDAKGQEWRAREPAMSVTDAMARLLAKSDRARTDLFQALGDELGYPKGADLSGLRVALEAAVKLLVGRADARTVKP